MNLHPIQRREIRDSGRRWFAVVAVLAGLIAPAGCNRPAPAPATQIVALTGSTMGTTYSVKLVALPDGIDKATLQGEIDEILETVNNQMSTWRPDSELSRFNATEDTGWFEVSPDTQAVVEEALRVSRLTDGAFDVTVGPLVNLWNFGPDERGDRTPTDAELDAVRGAVGFAKIAVRGSPAALRKEQSDVYVDLSAIAKGFGVDKLAEHLGSRGVTAFMVEIGGEVRTKGYKPDGSGWSIGIETPTVDRRGVQTVVTLVDMAMATSGDYRNYREVECTRISHTIDPRTGRPVDHAMASVTVVAGTCMTADALATALMVLGPADGYNFAVEQNLPALFIVREDGQFIERPTPAFEQLHDRP